MTRNELTNQFFHQYFAEWLTLYKEGAVRAVTLRKYQITQQHLAELAPNLKMNQLDRRAYQNLLNDYAATHERQTTMDFHHQIKGAILDALDDGILLRDPTRKVVLKGKPSGPKKTKFLSQFELQALVKQLSLTTELSWDWFILLCAKTGLRFAEALALTPADFDFLHQIVTIDKTWDYKNQTGTFQPTKNAASVRKVQIDWQLAIQLSQLVKELPSDKPIFIRNGVRVFNSTINNKLSTYCTRAEIPIISIHGLRHTHASLLLFSGVSIASVAKRLGHSNMTTTQKTYFHIIQELENQDNDKIMRYLATLV
jgi:integrase